MAPAKSCGSGRSVSGSSALVTITAMIVFLAVIAKGGASAK